MRGLKGCEIERKLRACREKIESESSENQENPERTATSGGRRIKLKGKFKFSFSFKARHLVQKNETEGKNFSSNIY